MGRGNGRRCVPRERKREGSKEENGCGGGTRIPLVERNAAFLTGSEEERNVCSLFEREAVDVLSLMNDWYGTRHDRQHELAQADPVGQQVRQGHIAKRAFVLFVVVVLVVGCLLC